MIIGVEWAKNMKDISVSLEKQLVKFIDMRAKSFRTAPHTEKRLKIAVAREFGLPTYKHVNLQKTLEYLQWRESPEGKLNKFLDNMREEQARRATKVRND